MDAIEQYEEFIKSVFNRYSYLEEDTFQELMRIGEIQNVEKRTILQFTGKTAKSIYILIEGVVVSYFLCKDGNQYHKNIFVEGDFVASTVSAIKNEPSNFVLKTLEDSTLIRFSYKKYKALMNTYPDLKNFYIAYLEKNWVIDKEKREIEIVMKEASERYVDFITAYPNIENRIPLHYIASHLGITPTQLSRIRKKIKKSYVNQHM